MVYDATLATRAEYERESERTIAHDLEEALGTGWAPMDGDATLRALGRGQVRTLLVDADAQGPGFPLASTGRLAVIDKDLRGRRRGASGARSSSTMPSRRRSGRASRSKCSTSRRPEAAIDGLAGLLRFR